MKMINSKVKHKAFGTGTVIEIAENYILVDFQGERKKIQYPEAFEKFIKFDNSTLQDYALELLTQKRERLAEERRKVEEKKSQQVTNLHISKPTKYYSTSSKGNIAFKCNYCNGGEDENNIGYMCACSDEIIKYNIEVAHHNWCCDNMSHCKQYYDGKISREELDEVSSQGNKDICYESQMLRNWAAYAGFALTKQNHLRPLKLNQVRMNGLAVLTTRLPYMEEKDRFIFAVFLADKAFPGDDIDAGFVSCDNKYKISLTKDEAKKLLFWDYYHNENAPEKTMWGQGLQRYLTNKQSVDILKAIVSIKKGTDDETFAQEFLEHFCDINRIELSNI